MYYHHLGTKASTIRGKPSTCHFIVAITGPQKGFNPFQVQHCILMHLSDSRKFSQKNVRAVQKEISAMSYHHLGTKASILRGKPSRCHFFVAGTGPQKGFEF